MAYETLDHNTGETDEMSCHVYILYAKRHILETYFCITTKLKDNTIHESLR